MENFGRVTAEQKRLIGFIASQAAGERNLAARGWTAGRHA